MLTTSQTRYSQSGQIETAHIETTLRPVQFVTATSVEHDAFIGDHAANENRDADAHDGADGLSSASHVGQPSEDALDAMLADSFPCSDPYC